MTLYDPAWLDAQYNNRARIPGALDIIGRWAEDSARARARLAGRLDLPYGDGPAEALDVFGPAAGVGNGSAPVFFFIHGGYWRALDKKDASFIAPPFVDAGAVVVVPNYALCPAVTIETITLQMVRALAWTWRNIAAHGGDARRIVVAGHSAGGHLAAMMASCRWVEVGPDLPSTLVHGALSISGLFELDPVAQAPFLRDDLRLDAAAVRRLSPARFPAPSGPLFATVGGDESEEFLRQNRLIRERWGGRAVPVCEAIDGTNHLSVLHDLADPHGRLHALALRLLGLHR